MRFLKWLLKPFVLVGGAWQEAELRALRLEIESLKAELFVKDRSIQLQADVIVRERKRVEAETAIYAARIGRRLTETKEETR